MGSVILGEVVSLGRGRMQRLRLYLVGTTVLWVGLFLAVLLPALAQGVLGVNEARTMAQRVLAVAVWTLPGSMGLAVALSWFCFWRRWARGAFYSALLPVVNVLAAGVAWLWEVSAR